MPYRPHVLGVDDAPFEKEQAADVPLVGVMMGGADLVEGVATSSFPVDGARLTEHLARWIRAQRWHEGLQAVAFGGITMAGLGLVDLPLLAERLDVPTLAVTRHAPTKEELQQALQAAALEDRQSIVTRTPPSHRVNDGLYVAGAGCAPERAKRLVRATLHKANVPEPLRLAHLIGAALVEGTSRGRV